LHEPTGVGFSKSDINGRNHLSAITFAIPAAGFLKIFDLESQSPGCPCYYHITTFSPKHFLFFLQKSPFNSPRLNAVGQALAVPENTLMEACAQRGTSPVDAPSGHVGSAPANHVIIHIILLKQFKGLFTII